MRNITVKDAPRRARLISNAACPSVYSGLRAGGCAILFSIEWSSMRGRERWGGRRTMRTTEGLMGESRSRTRSAKHSSLSMVQLIDSSTKNQKGRDSGTLVTQE